MTNPIEDDADVDSIGIIWLQPWCKDCAKYAYAGDRSWGQDDAWGKCEECGRPPVKYIIAPACEQED
jgi:hypothetical protein